MTEHILRRGFRQMMQERKAWPQGSAEWLWRTRAARKMVWAFRGIPVVRWPE
jgi:hypothetical protein